MGEHHTKTLDVQPVGKRAACVLLLLVMLFELGCAGRETILKMEPPTEENPGIELPADVQVSLKEETSLKGRRGKKEAVWKGRQMSGEITGWRDGVIVFDKKPVATGSPYKFKFTVPVEKIERIGFLGPTTKPGGFWTGAALGAFSVVAGFLLYAYIVTQTTVNIH
jgi:hypothetical protein